MMIKESIHPALSYSSGKITTSRDPSFRRSALEAYGYDHAVCDNNCVTAHCLILDHPVPISSLVVGHIFKHEWANAAVAMMDLEIDDTRNSLPLFKPLEDAFDRMDLCIICEK